MPFEIINWWYEAPCTFKGMGKRDKISFIIMNLLDTDATLQSLQVNPYFYNEVLKNHENSLSKLFNLGNEFENDRQAGR